MMALFHIHNGVQYNVLAFSNNWNKKLYSDAHTTIRLTNPSRFYVGAVFAELLKGQFIGLVKVEKVVQCSIDKLPEITCYLDTGYNAEETKKIIRTMYRLKPEQTRIMDIILLVKYNPEGA